MEIEQNGNDFYIGGYLVMLVRHSRAQRWHIIEANDKIVLSYISTEAQARAIARERCEKLLLEAKALIAKSNSP